MEESKTQGKGRLRPYQMDMYESAIEIEKHRIALFEAPTGFGKSVILNTIAETLALRHRPSLKIIITVPTNQLALELLSIFKKDANFSFNRDLSIDVVFGKNNYFDISNVSEELFSYIDKTEFFEYVENIDSNEGYLIDALLDAVTIEEPNKKIVREMIACRETNSMVSRMDELDITITNHAFFLTNVFHVKDFDVSKFIVLADEVHTLTEVAENMLTSSFSVYRYRSLTSAIHKLLKDDDAASLRLIKLLEKQKAIADELLSKYSNANRAGDFYLVNPRDENSILADIKKKVSASSDPAKKKSLLNEIEHLSKKHINGLSSKELQQAYKIFSGETRELMSVLGATEDVNVFLSPSRGYPTLTAARGDIRGWLLTHLWDKVYSFIGVSATIKTREDDKAVFVRLGVNRSSFDAWEDKVSTAKDFYLKHNRMPSQEDSEFRLSEFIDRQKKGYEEGWLSETKRKILQDVFGIGFFAGLTPGVQRAEPDEVIRHIKFGPKIYHPVFKREQAKAFLPSKEMMTPQGQESEDFAEWATGIASIIARKHDGKNSMVLCGSYHEAETIGQYFKEIVDGKVNTIIAERNKSATATIELFEKKGGVLFAIRNYGTGVNLPGYKLENLFIVKLPFPIFITKKWLDIKERDRKNGTSFYYGEYEGSMLLALRQWIGRLIRTPDDKGNLFILDSRMHSRKNNRRNEVIAWVEKMAIIQGEEIDFKDIVGKNTKRAKEKLEEWVGALRCSSEVKEYILKNTEHILKKKEIPAPVGSGYSVSFRRECREVRQLYKESAT